MAKGGEGSRLQGCGRRGPQHTRVLLLLLGEPRERPGQGRSDQDRAGVTRSHPPGTGTACGTHRFIHIRKQNQKEGEVSVNLIRVL